MAQLPKKIQDIVNKKQEYIDNSRNNLEKSVVKMQETLLNKVIEDILPQLDTKNGKILNTVNNLRLIEKLDKIYNTFNINTQANVVKSIGVSLQGLNKFNNNYFTELALDDITKKRFDSVVKSTNNQMNASVGIDKSGNINKGGFLDSFVNDKTLLTELKQMVVRGVTGQQNIANFKNEIKTKITGNDKVTGGFERYYKGFAYDIFQEYDRAYGQNMANEFNLNHAIYQGGLINGSRDFCRDHEGHVYTRDEISQFGKWTYAKAEHIEKFKDPGAQEGIPSYIEKFPNYNPFIHCGGFNCRHQLSWIPKEYAFILRPALKK